MEPHATSNRLVDGVEEYSLNFLKSDSWTSITDRECSKTSSSCNLFICNISDQLINQLEEKIDGKSSPVAADYLQGNVRSGSGCVFYKLDLSFDPKNYPNALIKKQRLLTLFFCFSK